MYNKPFLFWEEKFPVLFVGSNSEDISDENSLRTSAEPKDGLTFCEVKSLIYFPIFLKSHFQLTRIFEKSIELAMKS